MFREVLSYLVHTPIDPPPALLTRMQQTLRESMDRIQDIHICQIHGYKSHDSPRHTKRMCVDMRRLRIMPQVRIAKPLLKFAPGTEAVLRVPHARSDPLTLAVHAEKLAKVLAPHAKLLASAGYSKQFIAEFRAEAKALAAAAPTRRRPVSGGRRRRSTSRAS